MSSTRGGRTVAPEPGAMASPDASLRARRLAGRTMTPFVVFFVLSSVIYWLLPNVADQTIPFGLNRIVSAVVVIIGVRATRRAIRREWQLIAVAALIWALVDVLSAIGTAESGGHITFDGPQSFLAVFAYLISAVGVLRLARNEGMQRGAAVWLESLVASVGFLTVWWIIVVSPSMSTTAQAVSAVDGIYRVIYPIGHLTAIASSIVLLSSRAGQDRAARLLAAGCLLGVAGDFFFIGWATGRLTGVITIFPFLFMLQFGALAIGALYSAQPSDHHTSIHTVSSGGVAMLMGATVAPGIVLALETYSAHAAPSVDRVVIVCASTLFMVVVTGIRVRRVVRQVERQAMQLEANARTDDLTRLPNRRAGQRMLENAMRESTANSLHIAMLDLDYFKVYNDSFGHLQGDRLLRTAGLAWSTALGRDGMLYRYGGEEFVVILPEMTTAQAQAALERMRAATPRGQNFSAGLVRYIPGEELHAMLDRADRALYAAKAAGRGRTELSA